MIKRHGIRDALDLDKVCPGMGIGWVEQLAVQPGFVGQEQQTLGIHVQPAKGVYALGKAEFSQCPLPRLIRCELAQDAMGFVEFDDQLMLRRSEKRLHRSNDGAI